MVGATVAADFAMATRGVASSAGVRYRLAPILGFRPYRFPLLQQLNPHTAGVAVQHVHVEGGEALRDAGA